MTERSAGFGVFLINGRISAARTESLHPTEWTRYRPAGGITLAGIIVMVGIILIYVWSFWLGLIIALVRLVFFGGFARGWWH